MIKHSLFRHLPSAFALAASALLTLSEDASAGMKTIASPQPDNAAAATSEPAQPADEGTALSIIYWDKDETAITSYLFLPAGLQAKAEQWQKEQDKLQPNAGGKAAANSSLKIDLFITSAPTGPIKSPPERLKDWLLANGAVYDRADGPAYIEKSKLPHLPDIEKWYKKGTLSRDKDEPDVTYVWLNGNTHKEWHDKNGRLTHEENDRSSTSLTNIPGVSEVPAPKP